MSSVTMRSPAPILYSTRSARQPAGRSTSSVSPRPELPRHRHRLFRGLKQLHTGFHSSTLAQTDPHSSTQPSTAPHGLTQLHTGSLSSTQFRTVLHRSNSTRAHTASQGLTKFHTAPHRLTRLHTDPHISIRAHTLQTSSYGSKSFILSLAKSELCSTVQKRTCPVFNKTC